jgi:hypothetical protein
MGPALQLMVDDSPSHSMLGQRLLDGWMAIHHTALPSLASVKLYANPTWASIAKLSAYAAIVGEKHKTGQLTIIERA